MSDACAITAVRKMDERELGALNAAALDLRECDRLEITVTLYEHESAGLRFETWPHAVKTQIEKHLAEWATRNPTRAQRAVTTCVGPGMCVLVLHHGKKG